MVKFEEETVFGHFLETVFGDGLWSWRRSLVEFEESIAKGEATVARSSATLRPLAASKAGKRPPGPGRPKKGRRPFGGRVEKGPMFFSSVIVSISDGLHPTSDGQQ